MDGWSNELEALTREAVSNGRNGFVPMGKELHLKHVSSRYGYILLADLLHDRLRVVDKDMGEIMVFESVNDLLAAGWAVD